MLAAASTDQSRILELFDLALRLVHKRGSVPFQLSQHFNSILHQARALAENPDSIKGGSIFPEAIQLALRLREIESLREAVENVQDLSSMTPEQAGKILSSLEDRVET
jgi:hypothetical protein